MIIDTSKRQFEIRLWGLLKIGVHPKFSNWYVRLPGYYSESKITFKNQSGSTSSKGRPSKVSPRLMAGFIKRIIKTFKVKQFWLNLDSGDFCWNAQVLPLMMALSNQKRQLQINYEGNQQILLVVEHRLIHLVKPIWWYVMNK